LEIFPTTCHRRLTERGVRIDIDDQVDGSMVEMPAILAEAYAGGSTTVTRHPDNTSLCGAPPNRARPSEGSVMAIPSHPLGLRPLRIADLFSRRGQNEVLTS
jgi:hypothetical protein